MEGTESPILHGSRQSSHEPQDHRRQLIEDIGKTLTKLHYRGSYQNFDAWQADLDRALRKLEINIAIRDITLDMIQATYPTASSAQQRQLLNNAQYSHKVQLTEWFELMLSTLSIEGPFKDMDSKAFASMRGPDGMVDSILLHRLFVSKVSECRTCVGRTLVRQRGWRMPCLVDVLTLDSRGKLGLVVAHNGFSIDRRYV